MSINLILKLWLTTTNCWDSLINILHPIGRLAKLAPCRNRLWRRKGRQPKVWLFINVVLPHQKPKRVRPPVRPLAATPASKRTRWPRTLWTSWKTSRSLDGRSISSAEPSLSICQAKRSYMTLSVALIIQKLTVVFFWSDRCCVSF